MSKPLPERYCSLWTALPHFLFHWTTGWVIAAEGVQPCDGILFTKHADAIAWLRDNGFQREK